MLKVPRKSLFVDPAVQGAIVRRAVFYWAACLLFVSLPLIISRTLAEPQKLFYEHLGELWGQYWPLLTCAALVLPLVVYDLMKLTNRFAGPMLRLRGAMRRLAHGQPVESVQFRRDDFWREFAEYFNEIAQQFEHETGQPIGSPTADTESFEAAPLGPAPPQP